jgi:uncharacterized membrane protein
MITNAELKARALSQCERERYELRYQLFSPFKEYGRYLGTMLLTALYTFLWSLLLIIPGIIKQYSYSMTPYILKDYPGLQYNAAIEASMTMMQGRNK